MKRFNIAADGSATYTVDEKNVISLDMTKIFGNDELVKKAVAFAIGHVLRNATAGKMKDKLDEAIEGVKDRAAALMAGKWSEVRTGEAGESKYSILSQALAQVLGVDPQEAADMISKEVVAKLEEAGIDPETEADDLTDEQKKQKRKIAAGVRKGIGDDPVVKAAADAIRLKALQEQAAKSAKEAEGKTFGAKA